MNPDMKDLYYSSIEPSEVIEKLLKKYGLISEPGRGRKRNPKTVNIVETVYHDTEVLLKNYRTLCWALECEADEPTLKELANNIEKLDDLTEKMSLSTSSERLHLKSLVECKRMIDHLHKALAKLRNYPKHGENYYAIIKARYMEPDPKAALQEVIENNNLSESWVQKSFGKAIEILSILLWSSPNKGLSIRTDIRFAINEKKNI